MDKPMTPEEFLHELEKIENDHGDPESFHDYADELICNLLRSLGYGAGADFFESHEKWYG